MLIQIPIGVGVLFDVDMTFGKIGKQSRSSVQLTSHWISVDFVYSQVQRDVDELEVSFTVVAGKKNARRFTFPDITMANGTNDLGAKCGASIFGDISLVDNRFDHLL